VAITQIAQSKNIAIPLTHQSGNDLITIYQTTHLSIGRDYLPKQKLLAFNVFLKNLKAYARIKSLPEAPLPEFELTDSETQKLYKVLDVEWNSPRKILDLLIKSSETDWAVIGTVSMLNPAGYPFRTYSLFDLLTDNLVFEMGTNTSLGVRINNAGFGLLDPTDSVVIHGSYTEELFLFAEDPPINISVSVNGIVGTPSDPNTPIFDNASVVNNLSVVGN
jgi:hypothetical protein